MDASVYSVIVKCLYVRSDNPIMYKLKPADRTFQWRKWVDWYRRCKFPLTILLQPCPKHVVGEVSSSEALEMESNIVGDVSLDGLEIGDERVAGRGYLMLKVMLMAVKM